MFLMGKTCYMWNYVTQLFKLFSPWSSALKEKSMATLFLLSNPQGQIFMICRKLNKSNMNSLASAIFDTCNFNKLSWRLNIEEPHSWSSPLCLLSMILLTWVEDYDPPSPSMHLKECTFHNIPFCIVFHIIFNLLKEGLLSFGSLLQCFSTVATHWNHLNRYW